MDRNIDAQDLSVCVIQSLSARRAWIEMFLALGLSWFTLSLSARRAWIEISTVIVIFFKRNTSLSARRAWIEIIKKGRARRPGQVALRKESVDRNLCVVSLNYKEVRRSPQGERG